MKNRHMTNQEKKVELKYSLLATIVVPIFFGGIAFTEILANIVPDGIIGFILFFGYVLVMGGCCILYEFFIYNKYVNAVFNLKSRENRGKDAVNACKVVEKMCDDNNHDGDWCYDIKNKKFVLAKKQNKFIVLLPKVDVEKIKNSFHLIKNKKPEQKWEEFKFDYCFPIVIEWCHNNKIKFFVTHGDRS